MVFNAWSVATAAAAFDFEEEPLIHVPPPFWSMPQYPKWQPPDQPSYYSEDREPLPPETAYDTLPIWPAWRPQQHPESFVGSDEEAEEDIFIDKYENLPRLPVWIPPHIKYIRKPDEDIEPPEPPDIWWQPSEYLPPKPYFMPPSEPPWWVDERHPDLCPPPCLRRASPTCPPPEERPLAGPTPP
jgi:hypothetical protein